MKTVMVFMVLDFLVTALRSSRISFPSSSGRRSPNQGGLFDEHDRIVRSAVGCVERVARGWPCSGRGRDAGLQRCDRPWSNNDVCRYLSAYLLEVGGCSIECTQCFLPASSFGSFPFCRRIMYVRGAPCRFVDHASMAAQVKVRSMVGRANVPIVAGTKVQRADAIMHEGGWSRCVRLSPMNCTGEQRHLHKRWMTGQSHDNGDTNTSVQGPQLTATATATAIVQR
jgi:hypothetical protein